MIGLALSGGGSRAIAFHLGCLRALNDLGVLDEIKVLSTISGGSVIGACLAYSPEKTFDEFDNEIRKLLLEGFHRKVLMELMKPKNFLYCSGNMLCTKLDAIRARITQGSPTLRRYPSRTDLFIRVLQRDVFPQLKLDSPRRNNMEVVIGACELRNGIAFRFGNSQSGSWRHGELINNDIDLGFAVTASAAYPIFLPALDRTWTFRKQDKETTKRILLTDGGVYDNLGLQVLEPGRDPKYSLHTYPCDYLIACNAGHGQSDGGVLPMTFTGRVSRSFSVVHRRVQDASMNKLHLMKQAGLIKGFSMPYLGQADNSLPWKPDGLISKADVMNYPTNFAAMSEAWIDRLSMRGEQLTRLLVEYYLPELIS